MRHCAVLLRYRRRAACTVAVLGAAAFLPACAPLWGNGSTYYVSPSGSDKAGGTSPQTAWRTLARANSARLKPGTRLLLQGGHRYRGQLRFGPGDGGNPRNPVQVASYGSGRATIAGTGRSGVVVYDTAGIDIRDLNVAGSLPVRPGSAGIDLFSSRPAGHRLRHVLITGVDVSGFGQGISIGARHKAAGFSDVVVKNAVLHGNMNAGLISYGPGFDRAAPSYAHAGVVINRVVTFGNNGDPRQSRVNTGSGIVLGSVSDAVIVSSTSYGNGGANHAPHEGPIGIWAYDSTRVLMEYDVAYGNHTGSRRDGGGFGFDENTSDSLMQYNLAYGNAGPGFQLYAPADATSTGNVLRYNVSSGDGAVTINAGGIVVAGPVYSSAVYQNTVAMTAQAGTRHPALWIGRVHGVTVRNNILATRNGQPIVVATHPLPRSAALLQGNDYFPGSQPWLVYWGLGSPYGSLAAWRAATGQETVGGKPSGLAADPMLTAPGPGLNGAAATDRRAWTGFALAPGSALRGAGLNLRRLFGIDPGRVGYAGEPIRSGSPDIGAR